MIVKNRKGSPALQSPNSPLDATDFQSEATDAAIKKISDLLKHPLDLENKFVSLRKKIASESAAIDAQLKAAAESQLDDARKGLEALQTAVKETDKVKSNLKNINTFCSDVQTTIGNYTKIKQISDTHKNFLSTKEMVIQFQQLNSQISRIRILLAHDLKNINGPHDNILFVHSQIFELDAFKIGTLSKSQSSPPDVIYTLNNYFKKIDALVVDFDDYLWKVAKNVFNLVKNENRAAIVRVIKVIELEEQADMKAIQAVNSQFPDENSNILKQRTIKSYRTKFFDVLREGIALHLKSLHSSENVDADALMDVSTIIDDLVIVSDELVPCFPADYNVFKFFVLEYHRIIYEMVQALVAKANDGGSILFLLKWTREYYNNMADRLGVDEEYLEPRLLDGKDDDLMATYLTLVSKKLSEWLKNILETETKEFLKRETPPDADSTGLYMLSGSVIVFQMFNQQIDVVSPSSRGQLLLNVVVECMNSSSALHSNWINVMEVEYKRFETKSTELAEGLPEYIIALANDCFRSTEFSEGLCRRVETLLDEPWKSQALAKIKEGSNEYMKVAKKAYSILIDFAIHDSKKALVLMHNSQWYEQDLMRMVIGTYEDYCNDYQLHLCDYLYSKLTTDLLEKFVVCYLESFRNKHAKFKIAVAGDKVRQDLQVAVEFFSTLKTPKKVKAILSDLVDPLIGIVEANADIVFLDFYSLWQVYPDVPLSYIEEILSKREDLSKSQVKEIIESCVEKVGLESREIISPSLFSKLEEKKHTTKSK